MRRNILAAFVLGLLVLVAPAAMAADYPTPSLVPTTWDLTFEHGTPQRIVVNVPANRVPQAYWYTTYSITNHTDREHMFLPDFQLLSADGQVRRADLHTPKAVIEAIRLRESNRWIQPQITIGGQILLGEDESKHGVAVWPETDARMGMFSIFVAGLSGETATIKDADGKSVLLLKTLQLNFHIRGDEVFPGEDEVNVNPEQWIMR